MEQKQSIWCFLHKDDAMNSPPGARLRAAFCWGCTMRPKAPTCTHRVTSSQRKAQAESSLKVLCSLDAITTVGATQGEVSSLPNFDLNFVLKGQT